MAASGTWRVGIITAATALLLAGCLRHVQEAAETGSIKDEAPARTEQVKPAKSAKTARTPVPRAAAAPTEDPAPAAATTKTASEPAKIEPEKLAVKESSVPAQPAPKPLPEAKVAPTSAPQPKQVAAPAPPPAPKLETVVPPVEDARKAPAPTAARSEPVTSAPSSAPPAPQAGAGAGATPVSPAQLPARASLAPPLQPQSASSDPAARAATGEDRLQTARLVAEGKKLLQEGKVIEARRRFIAALNALSPEATVELARSFDTFYLSKLATSDGAPDMQRALRLYQTAIERGAKDAESDIARVKAALAGQALPAASAPLATPIAPAGR